MTTEIKPLIPPDIAATMQQFITAVETRVTAAMKVFEPLGYDYQRNLRYIGGHWYLVDRMPMTARQYRAWKRMQGRTK